MRQRQDPETHGDLPISELSIARRCLSRFERAGLRPPLLQVLVNPHSYLGQTVTVVTKSLKKCGRLNGREYVTLLAKGLCSKSTSFVCNDPPGSLDRSGPYVGVTPHDGHIKARLQTQAKSSLRLRGTLSHSPSQAAAHGKGQYDNGS